jgi:hypothetical protein
VVAGAEMEYVHSLKVEAATKVTPSFHQKFAMLLIDVVSFSFLPQRSFVLVMMFNAQDLQVNNSKIYNAGRDQHITDIFATKEKAVLTTLEPAVRNDYHVPRCMDGTCESVFKEINDWLNGMSYL